MTSSPENYNVALCREGAVNSVPIVLMSRVVKWAFCECTHHKELANTRRLHVLTDYLVCGALSCEELSGVKPRIDLPEEESQVRPSHERYLAHFSGKCSRHRMKQNAYIYMLHCRIEYKTYYEKRN